MATYDSIIVGAGHNGLVCAAYLAKSGQRVLVLEANDMPGGLAARREFHPGFHASVAHSVSHFSTTVASDLNLAAHGYALAGEAIPMIGLDARGEHVVVHDGDASGVSEKDAARFRDYQELMRRFATALAPFWEKTIPGIGNNSFGELMTFANMGINLRRMGKKNMQEFLRVASLPARDLMDEFFETPQLKAMLSWDGLIGSKMAPRSPNSTVLAMLYRMAGPSGGVHAIPAGGVNGLIQALVKSATAFGAEIRCGNEVDQIHVNEDSDGLSATGVRLAGGEVIEATNVVSGADPRRTFVNLVGVEYLDIGFTNRIRRLRCDGYVAKLHLALAGQPEFAGLEETNGRMIVAPDMDTIEFAFDNAKYGECPLEPVMEITVPSVHDKSLAPNGNHLLSAHVMYVPYALKGGWNESAASQFCERVIDTLAKYAPRIREQILHQELLTPNDLEQEYRVTGGHWHHTEFAMDQMLMMRPTYGAAQYSTPIPGLYLCGAGSHPAGDVTGAAGHNAAREVLR